MNEKGYVLYVRTAEQALIFEGELKGQLSDGNWENESTDSRLWNVKVIVSKDKQGCNFKARHPVDFDDYDLVDIVGDRMLGYARKVNPFYSMDELHRDLSELTEIVFSNPVVKVNENESKA